MLIDEHNRMEKEKEKQAKKANRQSRKKR